MSVEERFVKNLNAAHVDWRRLYLTLRSWWAISKEIVIVEAAHLAAQLLAATD